MNTSGEASHIPMSAMNETRLREIDQDAANMHAAGDKRLRRPKRFRRKRLRKQTLKERRVYREIEQFKDKRLRRPLGQARLPMKYQAYVNCETYKADI